MTSFTVKTPSKHRQNGLPCFRHFPVAFSGFQGMAPTAAELFKQAAEKRARLAGAQKGGLKKRKSEKPSQADDTPTDLQHAKTLRLDECSDRPGPQ